jgi:N-carbamoylputrescine amidase
MSPESPGSSDTFRLALAQMSLAPDPVENVRKAVRNISAAARRSASLCVLPEMFSNRYSGQFEDVRGFLEKVPDHHELLGTLSSAARRHKIPVVVPFIERVDAVTRYNTLVLLDAEGEVRAKYRKLHIPAAEGYREDLYFRPGDLGYCVTQIGPLKVGLAICWDQWFPEASRILALKGAQLIIYPSAIGSEIAAPDFDSRPDWELVMRAQAIMNRVFIAAVNRVGQEERIRFYGGSFVADPWGKVIVRAGFSAPRLVLADLAVSEPANAKSFFGFFDTRAPATYGDLLRPPAPGAPEGLASPGE